MVWQGRIGHGLAGKFRSVLFWLGKVRNGSSWQARYGAFWCCVVRCGAAWLVAVRYGRRGAVRRVRAGFGLVSRGTAGVAT